MPTQLKPRTVSLRPVSGADAVARARRLIEAAAPSIVRVLIDAARASDINAARLLLDRVLPVARSAAIREPIALIGNPAQQAEQVKAAMVAGRLTLEEAEAAIAVIEATQRIEHSAELVARIDSLERQLAALGKPTREVVDVQIEEAAPAPLPAPAKVPTEDDADAF
jgi:hypothetical protein